LQSVYEQTAIVSVTDICYRDKSFFSVRKTPAEMISDDKKIFCDFLIIIFLPHFFYLFFFATKNARIKLLCHDKEFLQQEKSGFVTISRKIFLASENISLDSGSTKLLSTSVRNKSHDHIPAPVKTWEEICQLQSAWSGRASPNYRHCRPPPNKRGSLEHKRSAQAPCSSGGFKRHVRQFCAISWRRTAAATATAPHHRAVIMDKDIRRLSLLVIESAIWNHLCGWDHFSVRYSIVWRPFGSCSEHHY